jgi:hypothetical protein
MRLTSSRFAGTVFVALLLLGARASGQLPPEIRKTCHDAYEQGQRLRRAGKLIDARANLLICARDPCPATFQPECITWLAEVERALPSVVFRVQGSDALLTDVKVSVDGRVITEKLDGREISVDPGEHTVQLEAAGFAPIVRHELFVEGEKAHPVSFEPPTSPKTASPAPRRPVPWAAISVSGVGVLGTGSFAYFGITGLARREDVLNVCQQHCHPSDISFVREHFLIADVSLGVAVVAAGVSTYLWIRWGIRWANSKTASNAPAALWLHGFSF